MPPLSPPPPLTPCIGDAVSFDFTGAEQLYSNLGGMGPDCDSPASIRYVNAGKRIINGVDVHIDLILTNRTAYTPANSALNTLYGNLAQISFAADTSTDLRVQVLPSCCTTDNCKACDAMSEPEQSTCYASGCCCLGATVTDATSCSGATRETYRQNYGCQGSDTP